jgi:hypothetical protein
LGLKEREKARRKKGIKRINRRRKGENERSMKKVRREKESGWIGRKDTKKRRREEGMRIGVEGRRTCSSPGYSAKVFACGKSVL